MEPWQRPAGAIKATGESAGDLILDGTRMWRGEVVTPGVFVDGPLILLGSRKGMVTALVSRDLLPEPVSENFPEISAVQILVEGSQVGTIAGHLNAYQPFLVRNWR